LTRIIAVANQKGGVGKTTTVANLGAALADKGKRVLLVDIDPQAALTATFGIDPYNLSRSMYSVLMSDTMSLSRILRPTGVRSNLAIAPASVDLASADVFLASRKERTNRLKRAFEENRVPFDYIIIDTPPSLGIMTINSLVAAKEVLIPVQTNYLAMRGVRALMESVWRVRRKLNPSLKLLGIVPTMHDTSSKHAREVIAELRSVFGNKLLDVNIQLSEDFAMAPVAEKTLIDYAPHSPGALSYRKLAEVIDKHVG